MGSPLLIIFRDNPEDIGFLPDGIDPSVLKYADSSGDHSPVEDVEITPREALASPMFRNLLLGESFRSFLLGSIVLHQIPHLVSIGNGEEKAASILGLMIFVSIPGRLVFGTMGDFLSKRHLLAVMMLTQAIGVLILSYSTNIFHVYAFVLIYGLAYGGAIPLLMAFRGELFGRKSFATISGLMAPFRTVGSVSGPIFAGYIFDLTGSYRITFQVFVILAILSSIFFYSVKAGVAVSGSQAKSR